jgi:hypothetical protein
METTGAAFLSMSCSLELSFGSAAAAAKLSFTIW